MKTMLPPNAIPSNAASHPYRTVGSHSNPAARLRAWAHPFKQCGHGPPPGRILRALLALFAFFLLAGAPTVLGQSALDGFDPNANGNVWATAIQADGKIIIGGDFTTLGGTINQARLARFNPDGSLDTSFTAQANGSVYAITVQPDGKILVGGSFTSLGGQMRTNLARLDPTGTVEANFNPGADGVVWAFLVQPNGKIVVGGTFSNLGGQPRNRLARLDQNGLVEASFDPGANNEVRTLELQADGKILVGGNFSLLGGESRARVGRLNVDGTLDTSFNPGANNWVLSLVSQPNGKILVGGQFTTMAGQVRTNIARLYPDGTLDETFTTGANQYVWKLKVQPDGKILVGGLFTLLGGQARNNLGRLNPDGTVDPSFTPAANDWVLSLGVLADNKIVAGGFFTTLGGKPRNRIARLYDDGSLDATWEPVAGNGVAALATQPDGKVLVGGWFTTLNGPARNRLARLNPDGSLDAFDPNANNAVYAVAVLPDLKVIAGGAFTTMGAQSRNYLARLNGNGTLDTTFNVPANGEVHAFAVQTNGQVLLGGKFTTLGGSSHNYLARLNANGTVDATFSPVANGEVRALAVQVDGKILVGGSFTSLGGQARTNLARIDANGNVDTSFTSGTDGPVYALAVQPDGKILVGGSFTTLAEETRYYLGRLNPSGSFDSGFAAPNIIGFAVWSLAVQADGKILVGGDFTRFGSTTYDRIARLNSNGSMDTSFNPGASGLVYALALQSDGKVVVGGLFNTLAGRPRNNLGRLTGGGKAEQILSLGPEGTTVTWNRSGVGPELQQVAFELSPNGVTYNSLGLGTRVSGGWQISNLSPGISEFFYIRARGRTLGGLHSGSSGLIESVAQFILPSTNANLAGLVISQGTLNPGFDPALTVYTAAVANPVGYLAVTPTVAEGNAWIQVRVNNGSYQFLDSGTESELLLLKAGNNLLEILVTAQDLVTVKTYSVNIDRALPPTPWLGAFFPPPQGVNLIETGGDGSIGRATNMLWLFSNIPVASAYPTFWGATNGGVKLSMDNNIYEGEEILTFQPALSSLERGVSVWSGQTTIPSPVRTVYTRFILAVTNYPDNLPVPMTEATNLLLPENIGGLMQVNPGMAFVAALRFEASFSANGPFEPALNFFDREVTNHTARAYSSFAGGFYILDRPPMLTVNEPLSVNRSQTSVLTGSVLAATDADSPVDQIRFTIAPRGEGGPPRNGVVQLNGVSLTAGSSFSQTDINQGRVTYVHNGNCETADDFTFDVTDDAGGSTPTGAHTTYRFDVQIAHPNLPPLAFTNTVATGIQAPYHGFLPATNLDCTPQVLTFRIVTQPARGAVVIDDPNTGAFTYTPNPNEEEDYFRFQVNDGQYDAPASGRINIYISNMPPIAVSGSGTTRENVALSGTLTAINPDVGDTVTFAISSNGSKGTAVLTDTHTGAFTYTPQADAIGSDQFGFTVNDGTNATSAPAMFTIIIWPNLDIGDLLVTEMQGRVVLLDHTGARFVIATNGLINQARGVTVDRNRNVLVMSQANGLVRIDPATGEQTLISSITNFSSAIFGPWGIAVEATGTILVGDNVNGLVRVDPVTGVPTVLTPGNTAPVGIPFGVTALRSGEIWVADPGAQAGGTNAILRIDPLTGAPTVVSSKGVLQLPAAIAVEASGSVLVANYPSQVLRINPANGDQTVLSTGNLLQGCVGLTLKTNGMIYTVNLDGGTVVEIDPLTGNQTPFSSGFEAPAGIAVLQESPVLLMFTSCHSPSSGLLRLQACGQANITYTLQVSSNLVNWVNFTNVLADPEGLIDYLDSTAPHGPACYYRLKWP